MSQSTLHSGFGRWSVEHLRLTIFHSSSANVLPLWERLVGVPPESKDERPREGLVHQQGGMGGNHVLLTTHADRLDWVITPRPDVDPGLPPAAMRILMNPDQAMATLREALRLSLRSVGSSVNRLAFGASLGQQVADPDEGTRRIVEYLPYLKLKEQDISDLVYQINRRRQSSIISHIRLNRVARWSSEQIIGNEMAIAPNQMPQLRSVRTTFVNKLVLDVNTVPEVNSIADGKLPALFAEMVEMARKVASEGDVV